MEIIVDASAIMAVIVKEPERDLVIQLTKDAVIISPNMVSYEIANGLTNKIEFTTFDGNMSRVGKEIGINIMGG
ncbi:MAG: hypothetical protein LBK56_08430 [Gracilibacteraceae bacterium]|jgi:predicted nucleic acid-binding protein|nr:hypothetical protein [Gracilibacteraceae bacterium]